VVTRTGEIRADKLVASNADLRQTLTDLVGPDHLPDHWVRRAENFRYGPSHVLATPMFCLYEAPAYKSARWDPDIDKTFYTVVGFDAPDDTVRYIATPSRAAPEPAAGTWVNSLWDQRQAPRVGHSATGMYFFPPASELSPPSGPRCGEKTTTASSPAGGEVRPQHDPRQRDLGPAVHARP